MATKPKPQLKRTAAALQNIVSGKSFIIPGRKWIDPVALNGGRFLRIDKSVTTLRCCDALEHRMHQRTADDLRLVCAVLRDERKPHRLWTWSWDMDRGVHIIEPAGTDIEALDQELAQRFPHA